MQPRKPCLQHITLSFMMLFAYEMVTSSKMTSCHSHYVSWYLGSLKKSNQAEAALSSPWKVLTCTRGPWPFEYVVKNKQTNKQKACSDLAEENVHTRTTITKESKLPLVRSLGSVPEFSYVSFNVNFFIKEQSSLKYSWISICRGVTCVLHQISHLLKYIYEI